MSWRNAVEISKGVYWVGVRGWNRRLFDAVYVDQQIVAASIRKSPIQPLSVIINVPPAPYTTKKTPINESITLCQTFRLTLSTPKTELKRATKMGVVP